MENRLCKVHYQFRLCARLLRTVQLESLYLQSYEGFLIFSGKLLERIIIKKSCYVNASGCVVFALNCLFQVRHLLSARAYVELRIVVWMCLG